MKKSLVLGALGIFMFSQASFAWYKKPAFFKGKQPVRGALRGVRSGAIRLKKSVGPIKPARIILFALGAYFIKPIINRVENTFPQGLRNWINPNVAENPGPQNTAAIGVNLQSINANTDSIDGNREVIDLLKFFVFGPDGMPKRGKQGEKILSIFERLLDLEKGVKLTSLAKKVGDLVVNRKAYAKKAALLVLEKSIKGQIKALGEIEKVVEKLKSPSDKYALKADFDKLQEQVKVLNSDVLDLTNELNGSDDSVDDSDLDEKSFAEAKSDLLPITTTPATT